MRIDEWIELLTEIKNGEKDGLHSSFPNPQLLGMKVSNVGINMMLTEQEYGAELKITYIDFYHKKGLNVYETVKHYGDEPDPVLPKPKPTHTNVRGLLKRKKKKESGKNEN